MSTSQRANRRFQFSIASILATTFIVGVASAFWRLSPTVFWIALFGAIAANVLGIVVAFFITCVLRVPNDGSLRWESENTAVTDDYPEDRSQHTFEKASMSERLVTVATFSTPEEATISRIQLDAHGIRTFLTDEATVGMAWHLGVAVGGVKLQVVEDDVKLAVKVLEKKGSGASVMDDGTDLDATAGELKQHEYYSQDESYDSRVDEIVTRAFRAAVFGLLFLPLQWYSLWLLARRH